MNTIHTDFKELIPKIYLNHRPNYKIHIIKIKLNEAAIKKYSDSTIVQSESICEILLEDRKIQLSELINHTILDKLKSNYIFKEHFTDDELFNDNFEKHFNILREIKKLDIKHPNYKDNIFECAYSEYSYPNLTKIKRFIKNNSKIEIRSYILNYLVNQLIILLFNTDKNYVFNLIQLRIINTLYEENLQLVHSRIYPQKTNSESSVNYIAYCYTQELTDTINNNITILTDTVITTEPFQIQVISNIFDKWGLVDSNTPTGYYAHDFIDVNAIIQLSAKDITVGRNLPSHTFFNSISSTPYEGEYLNTGGIIFPKMNKDGWCKSIDSIPTKFASRISIYSNGFRYIRKLLELTNVNSTNNIESKDSSQYYLVGDSRYIYGIAQEKNFSDYHKIEFTGFMKWNLYQKTSQSDSNNDEIPILGYDENQYLCQTSKGSHEITKDIINKLDNLAVDVDTQKLEKIISTCSTQKHGTMLVIYINNTDAITETSRLVDKERGIQFETPINFNNSLNLILNLSAIDGALSIDIHGNCYGCGLILDGEAVALGSVERGARYNSGKNYVKWLKERNTDNNSDIFTIDCVVLIFSEDGSIDLIDYDSTHDTIKLI